MNKHHLRKTMLELESDSFDVTTEAYREYFASAMLDRSQPVQIDDLAQAVFAQELAAAVHRPIHDHAGHLAKLNAIDFGPKTSVEEGAVVRIGGCNLVVAVPTAAFVCDGERFIGVSADAPIIEAMRGKHASESFSFNGQPMSIELIA